MASVTSAFDGGNIEVVEIKDSTFSLKIKKDPFTKTTDNMAHSMWFSFKVSNVKGMDCKLNLINAGDCSYPNAWPGYRAACSYDRETWFRAPTTYDADSGVLAISLTPEHPQVWVSYFAPFTYEQHQALIARCQAAPAARVRSLGQTLDGRDLDIVEAGTGPVQAWFIARQHPGETMAEWWAQGLLGRLLDPHDALSRKLLKLATFHIIPNMCPDGGVRGHLRTNAGGANLNREWKSQGDYIAPSLERSPEVYWTLKEMDKTGVDFCIDAHGDEELPHNFFAGAQGSNKWSLRHAKLLEMVNEAYQQANPDFQTRFNYSNQHPGESVLTMCSDHVMDRFDCLAVTLEQPFKDCYDTPDAKHGYSPQRCERLGASALDAFAAVVHNLRVKLDVDEASLPDYVLPGYRCPVHEEPTWE